MTIKESFQTIVLIAALGFAASLALADETPWCSPDLEKGTYCKANYEDLSPTQATAGMKAVAEKVKNMEELSEKELTRYLKDHEIPVVLYKDQIYLLDHHHMVLALHKADIDRDKVFLRVTENWSHLSTAEFWKRMVSRKYCRLTDAKGKAILPSQLPKKIWNLKDDPYRSLAYFAREQGAFKKIETPFVEFLWADYYRKKISAAEVKRSFSAALKKAILLSHSRAAKNLPGFHAKPCEESLR